MGVSHAYVNAVSYDGREPTNAAYAPVILLYPGPPSKTARFECNLFARGAPLMLIGCVHSRVLSRGFSFAGVLLRNRFAGFASVDLLPRDLH